MTSLNNAVIIRFGELGIKSAPVRKRMQRVLIRNLKFALSRAQLSYSDIYSIYSRIIIHTSQPEEVAQEIANSVFGIVKVHPARVAPLPQTLEELKDMAVSYFVPQMPNGCTFRVSVRRDIPFSANSQEIQAEIGAAISSALSKENKQCSVDLTHFTFHAMVELRHQATLFFSQTLHGLGGLPIGVQDPLVAVVCTEEDALAALSIARRGVPLIPLLCLFPSSSHLSSFLSTVFERIPLFTAPVQLSLSSNDRFSSSSLALIAKKAEELLSQYSARGFCCSLSTGVQHGLQNLLPSSFPVLMPNPLASEAIFEKLRRNFNFPSS